MIPEPPPPPISNAETETQQLTSDLKNPDFKLIKPWTPPGTIIAPKKEVDNFLKIATEKLEAV